MNTKTQKFLEEYKSTKPLYRDLSNTVNFILKTLLEKSSIKKYLLTTPREKSLDSLRKKLKKKTRKKDTDLAGCRVAFYVENDIERFKKYIYEEFNVIDEKLHYSSKDNEGGYNATHIIVNLNKERVNLPEYEKFKDLKCEIQLTTVLYHAWAELEHDITYKIPNEISKMFKNEINILKKKFSKVVEDHIKPAQHELNYIADYSEKISRGVRIFDIDFFRNIEKATSNNELYQNLKSLLSQIEEFGDKTTEGLNIINVVNNSLKRARELGKKPIKTTFGKLPGYDYTDIAEVSLDIFERLRFVHMEEIFKALLVLSVDSNEEIKKKAQDVLLKLAKYMFWPKEKKIYYHPQLFILDKVEKLNKADLIKYSEAINILSGQLLSLSFEGTSWKDHKTFVFHRGSLPASDTLEKIRIRTIKILKKLYDFSKSIKQKNNILQSLEKASRTPGSSYSDAIETIVLKNTNDLISFYIQIISTADNETIKIIEEQTHWFTKRFKKRIRNLRKLKALISGNTKYEMYKVFVGYNHRFSEDLDWHKTEEIRRNKIQAFIKKITKSNFKEWQSKILLIIKNYSLSEPGEFQYFNIFLFELGRQKPDIALMFIQKNEKELKPFLEHLVAGIWKSKKQKVAKTIISDWISQGKYLIECAYIFDYVQEIDEQLLKKVFQKSKERKDVQALINIIRSIVKNYPKSKSLKLLFLNSIRELTRNNNASWVNYVWYKDDSIFKTFTKKEFDIVLENLTLLSNIDYHAEEILKPIAEQCPRELIKFFYDRVVIKSKRKRDLDDRYDAIPFKFHKLGEILKRHEKVIIPMLLSWYEKGTKESKWLFQWEASHLLEDIFPGFNPVLEKSLIDIVAEGNKKSRDIVFSVLSKYKGGNFLWGIVKTLVKKYAGKKEYNKVRGRLFGYLSQTGMVSGEYGFVKAYQNKNKENNALKEDKHKEVRKFAKEYEKYLNRRIVYERKRADEEIESMKRKFG